MDLFIRHSPDEYTCVGDKQVPIREVLEYYLRDISFDQDGSPGRLRLRRYADAAEVIIDPRFAWGAPVVADQKVPVHAVVDLWRAGEPMTVVAEEFNLSPEIVESICRVELYWIKSGAGVPPSGSLWACGLVAGPSASPPQAARRCKSHMTARASARKS